MCSVESAVWRAISSSTERVGFHKKGLNKVLRFYGKMIDLLKIYVTIKSKEAESLKITDDERKYLSKNFAEMLESLRKIYGSQGSYLRQTVEDASAGIADFITK